MTSLGEAKTWRSPVGLAGSIGQASDSRIRGRFLPIGYIVSRRYKIGKVLGVGATSQVFEAEDLVLARTVAIKASPTGQFGRDLLREGRALASIQHPGVVSVYGLGQADGCDYLVLERLYGRTLARRLDVHDRRERLSIAEGLDILVKLCEAVGLLHRVGIVHRDIKPANVMLAAGGRPALLDLGISVSESSFLEHPQAAGTPHYMAPELVSGATRVSGARADIYALGCMTYEMVTGHVPYDASTPQAVLVRHISDPIPRLRDAEPIAAPELEWVVNTMMAKEPAERPASAEIVAAWLAQIRRAIPPVQRREQPVVVIAEDDEDMQQLLSAHVTDAVPSAVVHLANDGRSALQLVRRESPDLLLLDIEMPRLSGLDLCMHLCGTRHATALMICAISGEASERDRQLLAQLGVGRFIAKGRSSSDLALGIHEVMHVVERTRGQLEQAG